MPKSWIQVSLKTCTTLWQGWESHTMFFVFAPYDDHISTIFKHKKMIVVIFFFFLLLLLILGFFRGGGHLNYPWNLKPFNYLLKSENIPFFVRGAQISLKWDWSIGTLSFSELKSRKFSGLGFLGFLLSFWNPKLFPLVLGHG